MKFNIHFSLLILLFFNASCSDQTIHVEKVQSFDMTTTQKNEEENDSVRINFNWDFDFTIKKSDIKKIKKVSVFLLAIYLIYHLIELKRIFSSCFILNKNNAKINYKFSGYPISLEWFARYAIFTNNNSLLEKMLKRGASANFRDDESMTLLEYALYLENQEACMLLLNSGASISYAFEPTDRPEYPEDYLNFYIEEKEKLEKIQQKNIFICIYKFLRNMGDVAMDTYCVFLWPLSHYFRKIRLSYPPEIIDNHSTYHYAHIPFIINNNLPTNDLLEWLEKSNNIQDQITKIFYKKFASYKTIIRHYFSAHDGVPDCISYHKETSEKIDFTDANNFAENYNKITHSVIGCERNEKTEQYFDIVYNRVKNYHETKILKK